MQSKFAAGVLYSDDDEKKDKASGDELNKLAEGGRWKAGDSKEIGLSKKKGSFDLQEDTNRKFPAIYEV